MSEHIGIILTIPNDRIEVDGFKLSFSSELDLDSLPSGKPITDNSKLFFVVPTPFWNLAQTSLNNLVKDEEDRRKLEIGRAFRIKASNILSRPIDNGYAFLLKVDAAYDPEQQDLTNTIRWGSDFQDEEAYPFIALTPNCWNSFQLTIDRLDIRQAIRDFVTIMTFAIPPQNIIYISDEQFESYKQQH